jgi:lipoprotein-releasing system permease protein
MLFLAIRHLLSRKKQTILIFLGISLGTMMYTVISGVQLGMKTFIEERLLNNTSHIKISAREQLIDKVETTEYFFPGSLTYQAHDSKSNGLKGNSSIVRWLVPPYGQREEAHILYPQGWFDRLGADPDVVDYAPKLTINAIISRGKTRYPAFISGIIPGKQERVMPINKYVNSGKLSDLTGGGSKVIAGDGLLEKIGAKVGDTIFITTGIGELKPLKIVGTLHFDVKYIDNTSLYAHLTDVQKLNKSPGQISEIGVSLFQMDRAQEIADSWKKISRDNVESWIEANASFLQIFNIQDIVRNVITIAILVVAGFGIYNVLSITISQKKKEIAILRSMGYTPRHITELFLIQGIILGITGALIGLVIGFLANLYLGTLEFGGRGMGMAGGRGGKMLVSHSPVIYITGFLMAFVSAVVSSILPSLSAGKLTPIDIIRSEV